MELGIQQQIFEQLSKSTRVLVALPLNLHPDNVGSALAFSLFLRKMGKEADIVSTSPLPENLSFLPGAASIKSSINESNGLVISVDTRVKELDEISYQTSDDKVSIFVKSKAEQFTPEDVSFFQDKFPYDVVVVLDSQSLENLGSVFERHTDTFFETPKINIDNDPRNEYFGAINLVDINATSIAEILSSLLAGFETQLIDEDIATCLLTGIIAKTGSFQHSKTTPSAFLRASELVTMGGRQQEVVKFLYKTKSLPLLRLWGRALARLKIEESLSTVYSLLNTADFAKAEATEADLFLVLKEFIDNISNYKIVGLLAERPAGGTRLLLALHPTIPWEDLLAALHVQGKPTQSLPLPLNVLDVSLESVPFAEAETRLVAAIRQLPAGNLIA